MPKESALTDFGIRCREYRTLAGFVVADQAEKMGFRPSEISMIEQGKMPVTAEYLGSFCYWLRIDANGRSELEKYASGGRRSFVFPRADRKRTVATIRRFKQIGTYKPALIRGLSRYLKAGFDNARPSDERANSR
jgi:transcriptional regulator with XRE-family HTH domain